MAATITDLLAQARTAAANQAAQRAASRQVAEQVGGQLAAAARSLPANTEQAQQPGPA